MISKSESYYGQNDSSLHFSSVLYGLCEAAVQVLENPYKQRHKEYKIWLLLCKLKEGVEFSVITGNRGDLCRQTQRWLRTHLCYLESYYLEARNCIDHNGKVP
jgi:hypothetical protein